MHCPLQGLLHCWGLSEMLLKIPKWDLAPQTWNRTKAGCHRPSVVRKCLMFGDQRTGPVNAFLVERFTCSLHKCFPTLWHHQWRPHIFTELWMVWTGWEIKTHAVPDPCHGQLFLSPSVNTRRVDFSLFSLSCWHHHFRQKVFWELSPFLEFNSDDSSVLRSLRQSLESLTLKSCILIILFSYCALTMLLPFSR